MSVESRAVVFYGTWAPKRSATGRRLDACIDEYGGTPAPTGVPGVVIHLLGSAPTGDEQIAICSSDTVLWYNPRRDPIAPRQLAVETASTTEAIFECMRLCGAMMSEMAPVGWHFAARDS